MANDLAITDDQAAAVATAPRVSLKDIESKIIAKQFVTGLDAVKANDEDVVQEAVQPLEILTLCLVVVSNGFTVVGKSAPASPDNFNKDLGEEFAYEDAVRQLWPLMGYALRDRLARGEA